MGGAVRGQVSPAKRMLVLLVSALLAMVGVVSLPSVANAVPNTEIVVDQVQIGAGTGEGGQLVVGDTVIVSGSWDATNAAPQLGDTFTFGLPSELQIPGDIPFNLSGPNENGEIVAWATCLTSTANNEVVCTLTDAVTDFPELVEGTFEFEVNVVASTTESELEFNLNGTATPVELPGDGGIDDGIEIPNEWSKSGAMNNNNWSMSWTIDLPGANMQGDDTITVVDTLGAGHQICDPASFKVQTVRGSTVVDVTEISEVTLADERGGFTTVLTAPEAGFDPDVTYRITYQTCTNGNVIDEPGTEYENTATVEGWGDGKTIGVENKPWHSGVTKSGSVLGGTDRNGVIAWTVTVPGDQLVNKDGFSLKETLGAGHHVGTDTISGLTVTERYGPTNQLQQTITNKLDIDTVSSSDNAFQL